MANNIRNGHIDFSGCSFIRKKQADSLQKGFSHPGDVLLTHKATIGNTAVVGEVTFEYIMLTPQVTYYRVIDRTRLSNFYLRQFFDSLPFQHVLRSMSGGGTRSYIGITAQLRLPIIIPASIFEQKAIAEALGDADALIETLEELLTKKRQIRQGALQELLTGKRRLPGFSGTWEVRQLGELAEVRSGGTPSTQQQRFWDGNILWCTPTDITALGGRKYLAQTSRTITPEGLKFCSAEIIPKRSVVMTTRATIGECAINRVPVTTNQGFKNFTPRGDVDVEFLYYLLITQKRAFVSLCGGSTFLEIGKLQLLSFEVRVPPTKNEQTAIATILSDMDAEIAGLEQELAKARDVKQGMTQELLTGSIRLL